MLGCILKHAIWIASLQPYMSVFKQGSNNKGGDDLACLLVSYESRFRKTVRVHPNLAGNHTSPHDTVAVLFECAAPVQQCSKMCSEGSTYMACASASAVKQHLS